MVTQNLGLNLDNTTYQAALERASREGKSFEQLLAEIIKTYATGQDSPSPTAYTVQPGDTLSRIAHQVYGDPHKYPLIQQANSLPNAEIWVGQVLVIPHLITTAPSPPAVAPPETPSTPAPVSPPVPSPPVSPAPTPTSPPPASPSSPQVDPCAPIPGESYNVLRAFGRLDNRPAAKHGDINLALRGFEPTTGTLGLIDMAGPTDSRAPQLAGLFADKRTGIVRNVYRVHHWDWGNNSRGKIVTDFEATLVGFAVKPGETIHVPDAGYDIGQGYQVLVLYAEPQRITLKYTGEDNVVIGYTLHIEAICVEPNLQSLYDRMNEAGRRDLPALRAGQAFGRARSAEIQVAIRDRGKFMDPRTRKDWWQGR